VDTTREKKHNGSIRKSIGKRRHKGHPLEGFCQAKKIFRSKK